MMESRPRRDRRRVRDRSSNGVTARRQTGAQPAKAGPKLGRIDPCWCGSGKKYKRCHGA
jgi:uncharacterized protein YchJ